MNAIVGFEWKSNSLTLDSNPTFAFNVHSVEILGSHLPIIDHTSYLQHPVGQRGLAMVDVGDDAKIANHLGRGFAWIGQNRVLWAG
jgi:hypothetical protein